MRKSVCIALLMGCYVFGFSDDWTGTWYRNSLQDSAEIVISVSKPGAFHFAELFFNSDRTWRISSS